MWTIPESHWVNLAPTWFEYLRLNCKVLTQVQTYLLHRKGSSIAAPPTHQLPLSHVPCSIPSYSLGKFPAPACPPSSPKPLKYSIGLVAPGSRPTITQMSVWGQDVGDWRCWSHLEEVLTSHAWCCVSISESFYQNNIIYTHQRGTSCDFSSLLTIS